MDETQNEVLQESEFVKILVRGGIISEGQLKAVYDYQRSVGGSVLDILVKLNMMSRSDIDRMLQAAMRGEEVAVAGDGKTIVAIDANKLEVDGLKLHHRLIDKIPIEIIERCVLTVFFPAANLDSRKLIVAHGRELPDGLAERISSTLGIEVYTLHLDEDLAADFVVQYLERAKKPVSDEMKSLGARWTEKAVAQPAAQPAVAEVAEEEFAASNELFPEGRAGSGSDAGAPPAAYDSSSTDASTERSTNETSTDDADTRDDHETDSAEDDRTTRDPTRAGVTQVVTRTSKVAESRGKSDSNIEWTALLNLLVKKSLLTHEEVRVEIELLKRNKSRL